ncbi:MAG: hypothetical protein AB7F66_12285 [Bacteriovoracia bacterium]
MRGVKFMFLLGLAVSNLGVTIDALAAAPAQCEGSWRCRCAGHDDGNNSNQAFTFCGPSDGSKPTWEFCAAYQDEYVGTYKIYGCRVYLVPEATRPVGSSNSVER